MARRDVRFARKSQLGNAGISHSALGDLGNDDHPQYHNDTRGDLRYYTQAQIDAQFAALILNDISDVAVGSPGAGEDGYVLQWDNGAGEFNLANAAGVTDHTALTNIGTNTHAQIDTHIADATLHFTEGSIDHGSIAGLADDDHTQYHNDARGDARYYTETELDAGQLDNRYYTETEVDALLHTRSHTMTSTADHTATAHRLFYSNGSGEVVELAHGTANQVLTANGATSAPTWEDSAAGVSDHGALTGLGDDDHTQYHNDARGDARYYTETELDAGQLDNRYYTETEVDALLHTRSHSMTSTADHTATAHRIFYSNASGEVVELAFGADGDVLTSTGTTTAPAWETPSGGGGGLSDVVDDTTPQLGGNLDVNGQQIVSVSNGDIDLQPNGTGNVILGNYEFDVDQGIGIGQDNFVLTYDNGTGLISLETIPATPASSLVPDEVEITWAAGVTTITAEDDSAAQRNIMIADADGATTLFYDDSDVFRTQSGGIDIADISGDDPFIAFYDDTLFTTRVGFLQMNTTAARLRSERDGLNFEWIANNSSSVGAFLMIGDPDAEVTLYYDNGVALTTTPDGAATHNNEGSGNTGALDVYNGADNGRIQVVMDGSGGGAGLRNRNNSGHVYLDGTNSGGSNTRGLEFDPDTGIAFNGSTPVAAPTYTVTNDVTDRAFDANTVAIAELADVVGTIIADLQANGLFQ